MVLALLGLLALLGVVSMMLSWLIYVPLYMLMLKKRAPDLYERLGGVAVVRAGSLVYFAMFLINKEYLSSQDEMVHRHSRVLLWTLFGGMAVVILGALVGAILMP